jgi:hypothetical protein
MREKGIIEMDIRGHSGTVSGHKVRQPSDQFLDRTEPRFGVPVSNRKSRTEIGVLAEIIFSNKNFSLLAKNVDHVDQKVTDNAEREIIEAQKYLQESIAALQYSRRGADGLPDLLRATPSLYALVDSAYTRIDVLNKKPHISELVAENILELLEMAKPNFYLDPDRTAFVFGKIVSIVSASQNSDKMKRLSSLFNNKIILDNKVQAELGYQAYRDTHSDAESGLQPSKTEYVESCRAYYDLFRTAAQSAGFDRWILERKHEELNATLCKAFPEGIVDALSSRQIPAAGQNIPESDDLILPYRSIFAGKNEQTAVFGMYPTYMSVYDILKRDAAALAEHYSSKPAPRVTDHFPLKC